MLPQFKIISQHEIVNQTSKLLYIIAFLLKFKLNFKKRLAALKTNYFSHTMKRLWGVAKKKMGSFIKVITNFTSVLKKKT